MNAPATSDAPTAAESKEAEIGGLIGLAMDFFGLEKHKKIASDALAMLNGEEGKKIKGTLESFIRDKKWGPIDYVAAFYAVPKIPGISEAYRKLQSWPIIGKFLKSAEDKKEDFESYLADKYNAHIGPLIGTDGAAAKEWIEARPSVVAVIDSVNKRIQGVIDRFTPEGDEPLKFDLRDIIGLMPNEIDNKKVSKVLTIASVLPFVNNIFPEGVEAGGLKRAGLTGGVLAGIISELVGAKAKTSVAEGRNSAIDSIFGLLGKAYDFGMGLLGEAPLGNEASVSFNDNVLVSPAKVKAYLDNGGQTGPLAVTMNDIIDGKVVAERDKKGGGVDKVTLEAPDLTQPSRAAAWGYAGAVFNLEKLAKDIAGEKIHPAATQDRQKEITDSLSYAIYTTMAAVAGGEISKSDAKIVMSDLRDRAGSIENHEDFTPLINDMLRDDAIAESRIPLKDLYSESVLNNFSAKAGGGDLKLARGIVKQLNDRDFSVIEDGGQFYAVASGFGTGKGIENKIPGYLMPDSTVAAPGADIVGVSGGSSNATAIPPAKKSPGYDAAGGGFGDAALMAAIAAVERNGGSLDYEAGGQKLHLSVREANVHAQTATAQDSTMRNISLAEVARHTEVWKRAAGNIGQN